MVEVLSVPFDLCGPHHGSRLGSLAMELAGLLPALDRIGVQATVSSVVPVNGDLPGPRRNCDARALEVYAETRDRVARAIEGGNSPVVIGGDHSLAIGSISGALKVYGDDLAVVWIDAHMDANTPDTSPSGNLHGVPLGALTHLEPRTAVDEHDQNHKPWIKDVYGLWPDLLRLVPGHGLKKGNVCWVGLRDVDAGEVENLKRLPGSLAMTMQDIDTNGLTSVIRKVDEWLIKSKAKAVWISFDVDVLDPVFAPGTGTAVRGGLTYREGHLLAESLHNLFNRPDRPYSLAGLDVVEVNPLRDRDNSTAQVAVEWVCSFFGKSILHAEDPGRTEGP